MAPTTPTLQHVPRLPPTISNRSPSRSPRRKAQFAFRELDPLLGNLSPDSTLRALRATDTISNGAAQDDALTSSIADATPSEREVGIRAAFAAQKLREWKDEINRWKWPGKQQRGFGLGFIPPPNAPNHGAGYRGCLPVALAGSYEARIEEIKDDLDSLGIDEIKDHVLESHRPSGSSGMSRSLDARASYGRMRDFTALITATVIQALPDLAKLNTLLDTWETRLRVLRELPRYLEVLQAAQSGIQQASKEIRDPASAQTLREPLLDDQKLTLGGLVSDMGRRIDRLLDMLEGHDDTLPQAWIDRLEKIELDYATWVVEAQHVVLKNQLIRKPENVVRTLPHVVEDQEPIFPTSHSKEDARTLPMGHTGTKEPTHGPPATNAFDAKIKRKPSPKLELSQPKGHRREISRVSVADSTYSAFSDISNAEIIDAKTTSLLPSPKVSVVESPFRASRDELTWFGSSPAAKQQMALKPPMLQRASTASIEVISKEKLKEVVLKRSASWDMISQMAPSPDSTPSKALGQLGGTNSPSKSVPGDERFISSPKALSKNTTLLTTPSLHVEPLRTSSRPGWQPELPRRSSKRDTLSGMSPITPTTSTDAKAVLQHESPALPVGSKQPTRRRKKSESLDNKIQDILTALPTKVRLAKNAESVASSSSTSRASTPAPALTLSPAKPDPSTRQASMADPEIKLYHLTRTGQGREVPPVRLFVRTIGDGDRVMVRVGGGWADLGEYLKEYSLHHGSRATGDGRLEIASFPSSGQTGVVNGTSVPTVRRSSKSPTVAQFDNDLVNSKVRPTIQRPVSPERRSSMRVVLPPPVPAIPSSYAANSSTTTSATRDQAGVVTNVVHSDVGNPETPSQTRYSIVRSPHGVTTTTVVTPPVVSTNYTPLGGAGPKMNTRRSAPYGATPNNNEAWVQGMMGKARAVSGSNPTTTHTANGTSTTTTTTTTISSTPPSTGRRGSSYFNLTPHNSFSSPMTISTSPSAGSVASDTKSSRRSSYAPSSKKSNRMSLGDIGGIKRVFLRKKSEGVAK